MKFELSCPSKTFLLGEYLVLNSGSAMVLNLDPRFTLVATTRGSGLVEGINPNSPAGQWIRQNAIHYQTIDLRFVDPHNGVGGFGASSAQFLLVYLLTDNFKAQVQNNPRQAPKTQIETVWRAYRQLESISQEGLRPSGADIVAQFVGGFCEVHTEPFSVENRQWPFADCDIFIVHTGEKLATHEHLRGLKRVNTDELAWVYARASEALAEDEPTDFYNSVNDYYAELLELGLVAEHTQVLTAALLSKPFVRAVKGCGALGSDTLAVFIGKENRQSFEGVLEELRVNHPALEIVGDLSAMAKGYDIRITELTTQPESMP